MLDIIQYLLLDLVGFAIGFIGGLAGLVLGVVRFPFILGAEVSASLAAGTNIGVSTLGACSASIRHFRQNNVHLRIFAIMAATGAGGAFLGSLFTKYMPITVLLIIIGIIVSYEAFVLIRNSRKTTPAKINPSGLVEGLIGFGIGFLGGLVGLVLGSIRLPAMISVFKMEPKVAVGTNLAAASIMGAFGLLGHLINNDIDFMILATMGPAAMAGGFIGAKYTNRFNTKTLKKFIGIVLVFVAAAMFFKALAFNYS